MTELSRSEKIAAYRSGRTHSPETKAKISSSMSGRHVSDEARASMGAARLGKSDTDETKRRKSEAAKARHAAARKARMVIPEVVTIDFYTPDARTTTDRIEAMLEIADNNNGRWTHNNYRTWKTERGWDATVAVSFDNPADAVVYKLSQP